MDAMFNTECQKRTGEDLIQFLLNTAPMYGRYTASRYMDCGGDTPAERVARKQCSVAQQEFEEYLGSKKVNASPIVPPHVFQCDDCGHPEVLFLTDEAARVCARCGLQRSNGFEDSCLMNSVSAEPPRPRPPQYKPAKFLQQHMDQVQGIFRGRFSEDMLRHIADDLKQNQVCTDAITPDAVRVALKHTHHTSMYKHRWALAHKLNPSFVPVTLDDDVQAQLHALFQSCYNRLHMHLPSGTKRKNFFSYSLFLRCALDHLGHEQLALAFDKLKGKKLCEDRERVLRAVLAELTNPLQPDTY